MESLIWTIISFVFLCFSFLAHFPARQEYVQSREDLNSLGHRLNGSRILAQLHLTIARIVMWAHAGFTIAWVIAFSIGIIAILIPPVDHDQAQLRSLLIVTGLISYECLLATIQCLVFFITLTQRDSRIKWVSVERKRLEKEINDVGADVRVLQEGALQDRADRKEDRRIDEKHIEESRDYYRREREGEGGN